MYLSLFSIFSDNIDNGQALFSGGGDPALFIISYQGETQIC